MTPAQFLAGLVIGALIGLVAGWIVWTMMQPKDHDWQDEDPYLSGIRDRERKP